ncbi:MAG: MFS transporter, partial [Microcella sp.]
TQWAPMILLAPYGAMLADRFPRRITVAVVYSAFAVLAGLLGVLVLTGLVQMWHIVFVALIVGLICTVEIPVRVVFLSEIVPAVDLQNAISVYAIVFWFGGVAGPLVSGLMITEVGTAWLILFYAVACALVAVTIALLRVSELQVIPPVALGRPPFRETLLYARAKPTILWPLVLIACFAVFVLPNGVALSGMAQSVFQSGPSGLGLYSSMLAVGALLGALASTRVPALRLSTVMLAAATFASLQLLSGLMPVEVAFVVLMIGVGCTRLIYEVSSDSLVQLSSNPRMRGRVVSLYNMAVAGGISIGGLLMGTLTDLWGAQVAIVVTAAVPCWRPS